MELGTIERQLHIDASPEVVFDVVSSPSICASGGRTRPISGRAGRRGTDPFRRSVERWRVGAVHGGRRRPASIVLFRWAYEQGESPRRPTRPVVFELEPAAGGTALRMTESGFRERGWDEAKVAAEHADHVTGWDDFLRRLPLYAAKVAGR